MKRHSSSLIIRKNANQNHREISHLLEQLSSKKKKKKMVSGGEEMGKREPCALLVAVSARTATMENTMEGPQKIKNRTTIWPSNLTSGLYPKELKTRSPRKSSTYHMWETQKSQTQTDRVAGTPQTAHVTAGRGCSKGRRLRVARWRVWGSGVQHCGQS